MKSRNPDYRRKTKSNYKSNSCEFFTDDWTAVTANYCWSCRPLRPWLDRPRNFSPNYDLFAAYFLIERQISRLRADICYVLVEYDSN